MSAVLAFLGRLLIATALLSSAYVHYQNPSKNVGEFITNYKVVDELSNNYLEFDIPYDNTNWVKIAKIFGGFQALVAILVLSGDSLGGIVYLISLLFETFFLIWPKILTKSIHIAGAWRSSERLQALRLVCLIGIALVLICAKVKTAEKAATK